MTLLIKNVRTVGDPESPGGADVFVSGDKISAIGNFSNKSADYTLDGQGAYLAPGFIDARAESDHYLALFDSPSEESFLSQGITTIVCGYAGLSLAPLIRGGLYALDRWTDTSRVNVGWHGLADLFSLFSRKPLGVNFATFIGYTTVREGILRGDERRLTKPERALFDQTLIKALEDGGCGISIDEDAYGAGLLGSRELKHLAGLVRMHDGILSVALGKSAERHQVQDEVVSLVEATRTRLLFTDLFPSARHRTSSEPEENQADAEFARALGSLSGQNVRFVLTPGAGRTLPITQLLPPWIRKESMPVMQEKISDPWLHERIHKEMPRLNPKDITVAQARGNDSLVGRTLHEIMRLYRMRDPAHALLRLMKTADPQITIAFTDPDDSRVDFLFHRLSLIATHETGNKQVDQWNRKSNEEPFMRFLRESQSGRRVALHDAIRKITRIPARFFGLAGRGELFPGSYADLTGFFLRETADGVIPRIAFVIVNGEIAWKDGVFQNVFAGRPLLHKKYDGIP